MTRKYDIAQLLWIFLDIEICHDSWQDWESIKRNTFRELSTVDLECLLMLTENGMDLRSMT